MLQQGLALLQTQQQTLAPQQQFALKLLQMPAAELLANAELIAEENPFLEQEEQERTEETDTSEPKLFEESEEGVNVPDHFCDTADQFAEVRPLERIYSSWVSSGTTSFDDSPAVEKIASSESLREYLLAELGSINISSSERLLVSCLIEELDERGFLTTPIEEIAKSYRSIANAPSDAWKAALSRLQSFDPPGIGASSAVDALIIQTQRASTEARVSKAAADVLCDLLKNDLAGLAKNDLKRMRLAFKRLKMSPEDSILEEGLDFLHTLNPHPASAFVNDTPQYVIADLIVYKINSNVNDERPWRVALNPAASPAIKLSDAVALDRIPEDSLLSRYLNEAKDFIAALEARRATLVATARFAIEHQQRFYNEGQGELAPLTIQEAAEALGLAESTVSRAVSGKFLQTPRGTIELRSLFNRAVLKSGEALGESVSQHKIRTRIVEIIRAEPTEKPLSDQAVTSRLQQEGYDITRRTVAKYRDLEGIPPARFRARGE